MVFRRPVSFWELFRSKDHLFRNLTNAGQSMSKHPWRSLEYSILGSRHFGRKHLVQKKTIRQKSLLKMELDFNWYTELARHDTHDSWRIQMRIQRYKPLRDMDMQWLQSHLQKTTLPVLLIASPVCYKYHQILLVNMFLEWPACLLSKSHVSARLAWWKIQTKSHWIK